jgi:hypothetical protein
MAKYLPLVHEALKDELLYHDLRRTYFQTLNGKHQLRKQELTQLTRSRDG